MATLRRAAEEAVTDEVDCVGLTTREVNARLRAAPDGAHVRLLNPAGRHSLAVGLANRVTITVAGDAGYYPGALGMGPDVVVEGHAGNGVAENLEGGSVTVAGDAGGYCAASARAGRVVVGGDTGARAAISLKGAEVLVGGSVGAYSAFMMQLGTLVVCGDAGPHLGDSLYEGVIFVGGRIASLGADAQAEPATAAEEETVRAMLAGAGLAAPGGAFMRVTSMRRLYHFDARRWRETA